MLSARPFPYHHYHARLDPMTLSMRFHSALLLAVALAACSSDPAKPVDRTPSAAAQQLVLEKDPGEASGVVRAKAMRPEGRVVIVGRVAGLSDGTAAFRLMDATLPFCGESDQSNTCPTPWDYCGESEPRRIAHAVWVEARDAAGQPIATPSLPGLRLLDKVKVVGELVDDDEHHLVLVASGIHRVERPDLPAHVQLPN